MQETINPEKGYPGRINALFLLTTSRWKQRDTELARLAAAVERSRLTIPDVAIHHHLLLQDAPSDAWVPGVWNLHTTHKLLSLSAARNLMLASPEAVLLTDASLIAFPDDDAWYADDTLSGIVDSFDVDPRLDFWFCRSGPAAACDDGAKAKSPGFQQLISNATSNTLFLRATLAARLGRFDETLGLGTPALSGEDTDYALRAFRTARKSLFSPAIMIGHRERDRRDRELYFEGALFAIARHAPFVRGGIIALVRKIAVGVLLTAVGRITFHRLLTSLRTVFFRWFCDGARHCDTTVHK